MSETALFPGDQALAANARRLYSDASLMLQNGRYPSAVALAILAIEEVGKHHIYRWKLLNPKWELKRIFPPRHTDKQAAFAAPFQATVQIEAMIEICSQFAGESWENARGASEWEKAQDFLVEGFHVSQNSENPEMRDRAAKILNAVATRVEERIKTHPLACIMALADGSHIDKEKQAAIYVDLDKNGQCLVDPAKVTLDAASFWVQIAEVAIASFESSDTMKAAADIFQKNYKTLPQSSIVYTSTAKEWRQILDQVTAANQPQGKRETNRGDGLAGVQVTLGGADN